MEISGSGSGRRRPFSILFRGCSFMIVYEAGVWTALQDLSPDILQSASKIYGASSGSIVATLGLCGCGMGELRQRFYDVVRSSYLPFLPGGRAMEMLRESLHQHLPPNAHQLVSGKLQVIITRVRDCRSVVASDFSSKEDLIQAIICSCFIPIYFGIVPPTYHGVRYVDGEIGMFRASFASRSTITVSAFAGEFDICPRDSAAAFLTFLIADCVLRISKSNFRRLLHIFQLPSCQVMDQFYAQGYQDALRYLERLSEFGINYLDEDFVLSLSKDPGQKGGGSPGWEPQRRLLQFRATASEDASREDLESTQAAAEGEGEASHHLLHGQKGPCQPQKSSSDPAAASGPSSCSRERSSKVQLSLQAGTQLQAGSKLH